MFSLHLTENCGTNRACHEKNDMATAKILHTLQKDLYMLY